MENATETEVALPVVGQWWKMTFHGKTDFVRVEAVKNDKVKLSRKERVDMEWVGLSKFLKRYVLKVPV